MNRRKTERDPDRRVTSERKTSSAAPSIAATLRKSIEHRMQLLAEEQARSGRKEPPPPSPRASQPRPVTTPRPLAKDSAPQRAKAESMHPAYRSQAPQPIIKTAEHLLFTLLNGHAKGRSFALIGGQSAAMVEAATLLAQAEASSIVCFEPSTNELLRSSLAATGLPNSVKFVSLDVASLQAIRADTAIVLAPAPTNFSALVKNLASSVRDDQLRLLVVNAAALPLETQTALETSFGTPRVIAERRFSAALFSPLRESDPEFNVDMREGDGEPVRLIWTFGRLDLCEHEATLLTIPQPERACVREDARGEAQSPSSNAIDFGRSIEAELLAQDLEALERKMSLVESDRRETEALAVQTLSQNALLRESLTDLSDKQRRVESELEKSLGQNKTLSETVSDNERRLVELANAHQRATHSEQRLQASQAQLHQVVLVGDQLRSALQRSDPDEILRGFVERWQPLLRQATESGAALQQELRECFVGLKELVHDIEEGARVSRHMSTRLAERLQRERQQVAALEDELQKSKGKWRELDTKHRLTEDTLAQLRAASEREREESEKDKRTLSTLRMALDGKVRELGSANERRTEVERKLSTAENAALALRQEHQQALDRLSQSEARVAKLAASVDRALSVEEHLQRELTQSQESLRAALGRLNQVENENESQQKVVFSLRRDLQNEKDEFERVHEHLGSVQERLAAAEGAHARLADEHASLQSMLGATQKECDFVANQRAALRLDLERVSDELGQNLQTIAELETAMERARSEFQRLLDEQYATHKAALEAKLRAMQSTEAELESLQREHEAALATLAAERNALVADLQSEREARVREVGGVEARFATLQADLESERAVTADQAREFAIRESELTKSLVSATHETQALRAELERQAASADKALEEASATLRITDARFAAQQQDDLATISKLRGENLELRDQVAALMSIQGEMQRTIDSALAAQHQRQIERAGSFPQTSVPATVDESWALIGDFGDSIREKTS